MNNKTATHYAKVDLEIACKLRFKDKLTYQAIAERLGCTHQSVQAKIKNFLKYLADDNDLEAIHDNISAYNQHKGELHDLVEYKLLTESVNPKRLKNASVNNVSYAYNNVFRNNQLIKGQATENVDVHVVEQVVDRFNRAKGSIDQLIADRGSDKD